MIDAHCHFLHQRFAEEGPALTADVLVERARAAGVDTLVGIATGRAEWAPYIEFSQKNSNIWVAAGLHPNEVMDEDITEDDLRALAAEPCVVALGETGLDYHYIPEGSDADAVKKRQQDMFRMHMRVAAETGLPVVIHTREAETDTLTILKEFPQVKFVLHCFTGSRAMAEEAVAMGGYLSFSGVVSFKKSAELREIAAWVPRDVFMVETDAPYLAPEPFRGKRCEPAMVMQTAEVVAACRTQSLSEISQITTENTRRFFHKMGAGA